VTGQKPTCMHITAAEGSSQAAHSSRGVFRLLDSRKTHSMLLSVCLVHRPWESLDTTFPYDPSELPDTGPQDKPRSAVRPLGSYQGAKLPDWPSMHCIPHTHTSSRSHCVCPQVHTQRHSN
jgi:hypothetical protein